MARSEYLPGAPRRPVFTAFHASIASSENQNVTDPRRFSPASYAGQSISSVRFAMLPPPSTGATLALTTTEASELCTNAQESDVSVNVAQLAMLGLKPLVESMKHHAISLQRSRTFRAHALLDEVFGYWV
jgi:hypothetical protein